ncbi:MAG TPA: GNAT family N-acetyltransferase [Clostridia bacterium]|jgi:RimJ/RimL family protein N-acetyltransferase|nr:MAG: Acetyltransferase (GNAT) family protein [Firmicutes bacterium ADurb.Bin146]HOD92753.1 GNAT family N-acetyltransferase [Clostridia bacterium]HQM40096.1 GNAT family N-acetyltransferase [Clostridia bacterium]
MFIKKGELTIRKATSLDAGMLCKWWNDGKVMANEGFPDGLGTTDSEIIRKLTKDNDDIHRRHIIEHSGKPIGEMNYRNKGNGTAEIGIKICDFTYQNKSYGTELLSMFINALFTDLGYKRIILDTNEKNTRAQYVYEKIGFIKLRINTDAWKDQYGELQSSTDYELKAEDYYISL